MIKAVILAVILAAIIAALLVPGLAEARHGLVFLAETDSLKNNLPVLVEHPESDIFRAALAIGMPSRIVRLFGNVQNRLASETDNGIEPAYLLISDNEGGFPRFGFYLEDKEKAGVGFVDLNSRLDLVGDFGALDQLFPHELAHVIAFQLGGNPAKTVSTQIHAIGVATNRVTAFHEGYAEHFQVMAIDDAQADSTTQALVNDTVSRDLVRRRMANYRRDLVAKWAPSRQLTFPLWFGRTEQIMRYFAVKENGFAHQPSIPAGLLNSDNLFRAYLLENLDHGGPDDVPRSLARCLVSEGVVSAFFTRWAHCQALREAYEPEEFYTSFGTIGSAVDGLDNVYLKQFHIFHQAKPRDLVEFVEAYRRIFPGDANAVDQLVIEVFGSTISEARPTLWVENHNFKVGTTLYDQFRGIPRNHVFDLNAASMVDLMSVEGIDQQTATQIMQGAPFERVSEISGVPGVSLELANRIGQMAKGTKVGNTKVNEEEEVVLSLQSILVPYIIRASMILAVATFIGSILMRLVNKKAWIRVILNVFAASLVGAGLTWVTSASTPQWALIAPLLLFAAPASLWQGIRQRSFPVAGRIVLGWLVACVPAVLLLSIW